MQVILHTGAHHTDDDRILKCLLNNKDDFSQRGISVPGPGRYRTLLKDAFQALDTSEPAPGARDVLVDAILDDEVADRMILSNANFFGSPRFALGEGRIYPLASRRLRQMSQLFEGDQLEVFLAIRNPATFVPNVLSKASRQQQTEYLSENPPRTLLWSELLLQMRTMLPQIPITVWCNEDTPVIWAEIIREIAGLEPGTKINGGFDLLRDVMSTEGMKRFRAYLQTNPDLSDAQKRRVITAFLDKYAIDEALEEELDLPGWTEELVDNLTGLYDQDVDRIQHMDGVKLIAF